LWRLLRRLCFCGASVSEHSAGGRNPGAPLLTLDKAYRRYSITANIWQCSTSPLPVLLRMDLTGGRSLDPARPWPASDWARRSAYRHWTSIIPSASQQHRVTAASESATHSPCSVAYAKRAGCWSRHAVAPPVISTSLKFWTRIPWATGGSAG
jgi:hypothetical protein